MTQRRDEAPRTALVLGYVAGAHGIRGALRIHLHDPDSEALSAGRTVHLWRDDAPLGAFEVVSVDPVPGKASRRRVVLGGIHDRDRAESLQGSELRIDRAQLPPLADDEYYLADAVGLTVEREREGGVQALGEVVGLTSNGVQDLFEVRWRDPGGRARIWLLPVLPQHIVDIGPSRILVDLPLGMLPDALEDDSA